ncbi:MAG: DUF554 family protein [Sphaerochaetaceae bacterium]
MPVGVIINVLCVASGGVLGSFLGLFIQEKLKNALSQLFGFVGLFIGILLLTKANNIGAVVLTLIFGLIIGTYADLDHRLNSIILRLNKAIYKEETSFDIDLYSTLIVLFVFSTTGIIGAISESATGDNSLLIAKAILDFFTAMIFSTKLGIRVSLIAVGQLIFQLFLFFIGKIAFNFLQLKTYGDFCATGGVIQLMVGFNILNIYKSKPLNLIISLFLIIPISIFWQKIF